MSCMERRELPSQMIVFNEFSGLRPNLHMGRHKKELFIHKKKQVRGTYLHFFIFVESIHNLCTEIFQKKQLTEEKIASEQGGKPIPSKHSMSKPKHFSLSPNSCTI